MQDVSPPPAPGPAALAPEPLPFRPAKYILQLYSDFTREQEFQWHLEDMSRVFPLRVDVLSIEVANQATRGGRANPDAIWLRALM
eukprot:7920542-Pyramimonas_sp.AAC.1